MKAYNDIHSESFFADFHSILNEFLFHIDEFNDNIPITLFILLSLVIKLLSKPKSGDLKYRYIYILFFCWIFHSIVLISF
jgi:hypothetical protein